MDASRRSAEASLLGYHYQLDKFIIELLSQSTASALVTIEGVEDIDVDNDITYVAIQCKYLEAQSCTPSTLRQPIGLMLGEYKKEPQRNWMFVIYAHFGTPLSSVLTVSLEWLKKTLAYRVGKGETREIRNIQEDLNMSDNELLAFLSSFRFEEGPNFSNQRRQLMDMLRTTFNTSPSEASEFIYCKALAIALETATKTTRTERSLSKKDFISKIAAAASSVTSPWLINLLGRERALRFIQKTSKQHMLFTATKEKTLVLDGSSYQEGSVSISLSGFLKEVVDHSFSFGRSLWDARPWTIIIDIGDDELKRVKRELLTLGVIFNDGFEHISFNLTAFKAPPIINRGSGVNGRPTEKLGIASYRCRIASMATIEPHIADIPLDNVLLCISSSELHHKIRSSSRACINIGSQWTKSELLTIIKA